VIVLKFGGSSVDGAAGIARVAEIVRRRLAARPIVVVSAMAKTTRRLLDGAEAAAAGSLGEALEGAAALEEFHRQVAAAVVGPAGRARLGATLGRSFGELRALLERVAAERVLTPRDADAVAAFGEVMASEILALALPAFGVAAAWIDARRVMVTDDGFTRARPLYEETGARMRAAMLPVVEAGAVPVVGGYVGATRDGVVTTLGKEGSDFSAAIAGGAVAAAEVQIWTDVDGILTADPRLVPGAQRVPRLSFAEALELACSGSKKPHPGTLEAAERGGVPIRILNSLGDGGPGTLIGHGAESAPGRIKSLACRPNDHLLHVFPGRSSDPGFGARVTAVVERLRPALLVLRLDPEGAQLALDRGDRLPEVRQALQAAGEIADVGVVHGRGVVSLVSEDLAGDGALLSQVLAAAGDLQPRLVVAGAAAPVVRCLVEMEDLAAAVATLHDRLFATPELEEVEYNR
jgi:aspartate kinase